MIKFLSILLLLAQCFSNIANAEIVRAPDIKVIEKLLSEIDADTLVIFDVADVLLTSKDQILKAQNKKYKKKLKSNLGQSMSKSEAQVLYSIINKERKNGPVDPKMPHLISNLQSKGVKVLGLTNCFTGKLGNIESLEDWRLDELKRAKYDFEKSWELTESKTFENLESSNKEALPPVFKKGVIFASRVPKGKVLEVFLDYTKFKPKKIIFVDNKMKNIESVQSFANAHNISFIGIEYTAVIDAKVKPLNKKRADFQFETLKKEKKWLSDDEADKAIESGRK